MATTQLSSHTARLDQARPIRWKAMITNSKDNGKSKYKTPIIKDDENIGITQRAVKVIISEISPIGRDFGSQTDLSFLGSVPADQAQKREGWKAHYCVCVILANLQ